MSKCHYCGCEFNDSAHVARGDVCDGCRAGHVEFAWKKTKETAVEDMAKQPIRAIPETEVLRNRISDLEAKLAAVQAGVSALRSCHCGAPIEDCAKDGHELRKVVSGLESQLKTQADSIAGYQRRVAELEGKRACKDGCHFEVSDHDSLICRGCGADCTHENLSYLGIRHTGRLEEDLRRKREECERLERQLADASNRAHMREQGKEAYAEIIASQKLEIEKLRRELGRKR